MTDEELLQAIWEAQLKQLPEKVILQYFGSRWGLCDNTDSDYLNMSFITTLKKTNLTRQIGRKNLLLRIKELHKEGKLYSQDINFAFMIASFTAREAFESAREFWLEQGIPSGRNTDGKMKTVYAPKRTINKITKECEDYLLQKYTTEKEK